MNLYLMIVTNSSISVEIWLVIRSCFWGHDYPWIFIWTASRFDNLTGVVNGEYLYRLFLVLSPVSFGVHRSDTSLALCTGPARRSAVVRILRVKRTPQNRICIWSPSNKICKTWQKQDEATVIITKKLNYCHE